mmetsp:Transcript_68957/g.162154  ORF Transcript_68957/g.162154 Transcript_68957/m.162154 type:complete len:286 (+) Transcript_68957:198-1055(+)
MSTTDALLQDLVSMLIIDENVAARVTGILVIHAILLAFFPFTGLLEVLPEDRNDRFVAFSQVCGELVGKDFRGLCVEVFGAEVTLVPSFLVLTFGPVTLYFLDLNQIALIVRDFVGSSCLVAFLCLADGWILTESPIAHSRLPSRTECLKEAQVPRQLHIVLCRHEESAIFPVFCPEDLAQVVIPVVRLVTPRSSPFTMTPRVPEAEELVAFALLHLDAGVSVTTVEAEGQALLATLPCPPNSRFGVLALAGLYKIGTADLPRGSGGLSFLEKLGRVLEMMISDV